MDQINGNTDPNQQESDATGRHELPPSTDRAAGASSPPPPQGSLSIVFTDIVKSTAIWEANASAMVEAMQTHDTMVRNITTANHGYEVKQNGDGFMLAFPSATSAVQFCLDVQEQLLDRHWPAAILKSAPGKEARDEQGNLLFRGLQLRISAHWGTPVCNWNDVIQRMDYLGPTVNRAARFIEVTEGGQVVVSEDFLRRLQSELEMAKGGDTATPEGVETEEGSKTDNNNAEKEEGGGDVDLPLLRSDRDQDILTHQHFQIRPLGEHEFKGLSGPQNLYFIVPRSLEGRVDHWHQVTHIAGVKGNLRRDSS